MSSSKREVERRLHVRNLSGRLFVAAAFFYLGFHALSGDRGLYALVKETHKLTLLQSELAAITKERETLEHRTRLLSDSSLDLDLLDEESRKVLGYSLPGELVHILPAAKN